MIRLSLPILLVAVLPAAAAFSGEVAAEDFMLELVNDARADAGLPPLVADLELVQAARQHSWEMITLDYFAHQSPVPENATLPLRVANAGSTVVWVGENIGAEYRSAAYNYKSLTLGAFRGLMNSPPHRANILDPDYNTVGIGIVYSEAAGMRGIHVTQVFAARCFELERLRVFAAEGGYRLVVAGWVLREGYAGLFVNGAESAFHFLDIQPDGSFRLEVPFEPDSGVYLCKLGLGPEEYGSKDIYNEFRLDTSRPADEALIIGEHPY